MRDPGLDETYRVLTTLNFLSNQSQRGIASQLGYSLGKVNFILKAFVEKGLIKMENFSKNSNKAGYRYILTPKGISEKYRITRVFLIRKEAEYEKIKSEIEEAKNLLNK